MPVESNMSFYSHSMSASQTHSQSQAAEDSQSMIQQETQSKSVEFAHLISADQKFFQIAMILYENKIKIYNIQ